MRTLPGRIPGLIRRCSPVLVPTHGPGVVLAVGADALVWCDRLSIAVTRRVAALDLDLTAPTGQDHAMRWIAEHMGMAVLSEEIEAGGDVDALIRAVLRLAGGES